MVINSEVPVDCLRVTAPAKINLHLEVLGIRNDGFHELAMVMQSIELVDQIEIRNREDGLITMTSCEEQQMPMRLLLLISRMAIKMH